jgi:hypothetical protein
MASYVLLGANIVPQCVNAPRCGMFRQAGAAGLAAAEFLFAATWRLHTIRPAEMFLGVAGGVGGQAA